CCLCIQVSCTRAHLDIPNRDNESRWRTLEGRIVRERVLRLCDADGKVSEALAGICRNLFGGERRELDAICAIHLCSNGGKLFLDGHFWCVEELKVLWLLAGLDDTLGEINGSETALGPVVGRDGILRTGLDGLLADGLNFSRSVGLEPVDGHDD